MSGRYRRTIKAITPHPAQPAVPDSDNPDHSAPMSITAKLKRALGHEKGERPILNVIKDHPLILVYYMVSPGWRRSSMWSESSRSARSLGRIL